MSISPDPPATDYEQHLANLFTELTDRANRGEYLDLEEVCRDHPRFDSDLRELWGTVVVTAAAAKANSGRSIGSSSDSLMPGLELPCEWGDYRLEAEIGRGGMGIVYRATRHEDGEQVAIKMILKGDFATDADLRRFDSEAMAAAKLNHPHIIPIYAIGDHEGRAFFCMKLIQGQSLAERLVKGPIPPQRAARLMAEISEAIDYAHAQGILHRDLKPSNIMLDDEGHAYVADFGLAKEAKTKRASLTRSGAVLGTPAYMSPEQAAGNRGQVGVASDVYSLGAILYHMLTGRPPFLGASPVETVLLVLEQDPVAPRALNRRADRRLELIAMKCLQKPQDLRYASAGKLCNDIRGFMEDGSVAANEGRFLQVISNVFRETHHASILENWGLIWIWHSLVLFVTSLATSLMHRLGYEGTTYYWLMWTIGLGTWAIVFWIVRRRMGPVTFVERQIAHVWAAAMACVAFLFPLEVSLGLPVLSLAPLLGVMAGMVFLVKAGILAGSFYIQATIMFATAIMMAIWTDFALDIFGFVSAGCFFFAGLKYYRRKKVSLSSGGG
ncbi:MAG: serine/threonine-protein kinase [Planctomycetota bacterium]